MAKSKQNAKKKEQQPLGREEALQQALDQIEKTCGKGAIMRLGERKRMNIEVIPTGSIALDRAIGVGGLPKGRIIEIYGPESSGKTTVALHVVAECQRQGGTAAFIDAEHALDPVYAKAIGVDIENLLVSQPDDGEQALNIADALVRSGAIELVVVDSVAALTPRAEIEGEMGSAHMGLLARLMSQALRKLTANISRTGTTMIFINQVREKIGNNYGNPETTTGGRALKFYASVRLDVRRKEPIKQGTDIIGNRTRVRVVKNKVSPPFKEAEFDLLYGEGISKLASLIEVGVQLDVIDKKGAWLSFGEIKLGQGRDKAREFLAENPEIAKEVEAAVRAVENTGEFETIGNNEGDKEEGTENLASESSEPTQTETKEAPQGDVLDDSLFDEDFLDGDDDDFDV